MNPPTLAPADRLGLHRALLVTRAVEQRLDILARQGRVKGGLYRCLGQEAIGVGSAWAMGENDVFGPGIRELGAFFVRGYAPRLVMMQYMARGGGPTAGRETNVHFGELHPDGRGLISPISMLGSMVSVCTGVALAQRYRGLDAVTVAHTGDGAMSTGQFYEGFNLACVLRLPLVVIGSNNQWAYGTPTNRQFRAKDLAERAAGYGCPVVRVDGNDVEAVWRVTREARETCLRDEGPVFVEALTMRMVGHAAHDDAKYVSREVLARWRERDPIRIHRERLVAEGVATGEELDALGGEVEAEVLAEAEIALAAPEPDPSTVTSGVYHGEPSPLAVPGYPWTHGGSAPEGWFRAAEAEVEARTRALFDDTGLWNPDVVPDAPRGPAPVERAPASASTGEPS